MDQRRWQQIERVFAEVAERPGAEQTAVLERACGGDAALARQVQQLLDDRRASERYLASLAVRSGIPLVDADELLHCAGRRIGAYRLVRVLGRGGMGVVYLAERADAQFDKRVALKLLPLGLVSAPAVERFHRERQILASLEHPNIARLLDGGITEEGTPYYVMEYVKGVPLDAYCRDNKLSLDRRLHLFTKVCEAVGAAHRQLVVHRDLKPSNVLVTDDGEPKLMDFGVAKLLDGEGNAQQTVTSLDRRPLTPAYAAPEMLLGEPVTTACDVYSLGVMLFELLTGGRPFPVRERDADAPRHPGRPPPLPSRATIHGAAWARQLRGDLDNIVCTCLRPDPGARHETVEALKRDLERHRAHLPVSARPDSRLYRLALFTRRHRAGVAFAASFLVLVLSGLASTTYYAVQANREASEANRQRDRAQAVSEFLTGIFSAADPTEHLGREPSAGELLDRGARAIGQDNSLDETTRAGLTHLIGSLYLELADYQSAERLLESALTQYQVLLSQHAPEMGAVLLDLARQAYHGGELTAARERAERALQIYRSRPGNDAAIANALHLKGIILQETGEYDGAQEALNRALVIRRQLFGEQHESVARTLNRLGYVMEKQDELDAAEAYYEKALAICRLVLPDNDPFTASVMNDLGRLYSYRHRFEESLDMHRRVLAINRSVYGGRHPQTAISLHNIGYALHGLGRLDEAADWVGRALDIYRERLGEEHWLTVRGESVLAEILTDMGEYEKAEELLSHALAAARKIHGPHHRAVVFVELVAGYHALRQGRYAEAEAAIRQAAATAAACCASMKRLQTTVQARLAVSLAGQGRIEEARTLFDKACPAQAPPSQLPLTGEMPPCEFARIHMASMIQ